MPYSPSHSVPSHLSLPTDGADCGALYNWRLEREWLIDVGIWP